MITLSITGNLGQDARKGNAGGSAVVNFSVGVKSGYGAQEKTIWVDCSLWGKQAESKLVDYLVKGQQVAVSGEMGTRDHNDKTYITCRVTSIDLIGKKDDAAKAPAMEANKPATGLADMESDVPF
jgi:single-strand DNA-binding protein